MSRSSAFNSQWSKSISCLQRAGRGTFNFLKNDKIVKFAFKSIKIGTKLKFLNQISSNVVVDMLVVIDAFVTPRRGIVSVHMLLHQPYNLIVCRKKYEF